ncbi:S8/S53 family peptidase [Pelagibius marinus]|uniref:S8/S53 family peptidase n=1 Tax=Pelagibius marinus TaxID=2762760 RepID=UPI001872ED40|nr:S8/S53 family peptidase [Pelagibius marinus]
MAIPPWNIYSTGADKAWALLPRTAAGKIRWGRTRVAHLDTGYTHHEVFFPQGAGGPSAIILAAEGRDFLNPRRRSAEDPLKKNDLQIPGHGTRSGSALSADNDKLKGVAPGLPLVPFRVTNTSLVTGEVAKAIGKAINHVVANRVAPVVSISLGFPLALDEDMGRAVDRAYDAGGVGVGAAGQVIDRVTYPGKHRRTICAAGIRNRRRRYSLYQKYDHYGRIDAWAPADPIQVARFPPEDKYGKSDGTTYAAVHVAGAAAMWILKHGAALRQAYPQPWQRIEAFRMLLTASGRSLPILDKLATNAARRLDIEALLKAPLPDKSLLRYETDFAADDRL